jgi:hypothetical protein
VLAGGSAFTVITAGAEQPDENAGVIIVVPGATPVTTPVAPTIGATDGLLLVQVAPGEETSVAVAPTHMLSEPVIAAGVAYTVTTWDTTQLPPME